MTTVPEQVNNQIFELSKILIHQLEDGLCVVQEVSMGSLARARSRDGATRHSKSNKRHRHFLYNKQPIQVFVC